MLTIHEQELLARLDYQFQNEEIFTRAVTHKSYVNENPRQGSGDNERLELLGDAVLGLVVTELIVERFDSLTEGQLSKLRASLVSEKALAEVARELELGSCLRMGKGEKLSGGENKNSILSDALEALLAAIYLDSKLGSGIGAIERVVRQLFDPRLKDVNGSSHRGDYKTELQELAQKKFRQRTTYKVLEENGPDHEKQYEVGVYIGDREYGRGLGSSKKQSEQQAAMAALTDHFWDEKGA